MKKHIPNMITCCNLISGCIAIMYALYGEPKMALCWIIIGAVFDFFDGMTARLLHVSSPIGKELDSLADDVTFGVAPASMVFHELMVIDYPAEVASFSEYIPFVAFLIAAFSASMLVWIKSWPSGVLLYSSMTGSRFRMLFSSTVPAMPSSAA